MSLYFILGPLILILMIYLFSLIRSGMYRATRKRRKNISLSFREKFEKFPILEEMSFKITQNISVYNDMQVTELQEVSRKILVVYLFLGVVVIIFFTVITEIWYLGLLYSILFNFIVIAVLSTFTTSAMTKFNSYLPILFKRTYDRIIDYDSIEDLLKDNLDAFEPVLRRQIQRILNALKENNSMKVESELELIDKIFNNHLFSIYLFLILHSKFDGLNNEVVDQFAQHVLKIDMRTTYQAEMKTTARNKLVGLFAIIVFSLTYGKRVLDNMYLDLTGQIYDYSSIYIQLALVVLVFIYLISIIHSNLVRRT